MASGFSFAITARCGAARAGRLVTPHGAVETPCFMPVATFGAVRGMAPAELESFRAQMLLANTLHLSERPGDRVVADQGGLHGFTGWRGPWLTDSGGFQVTSLADRVRVDEEGLRFPSPVDGSPRLLSPERAVEIQQRLGADIAMALDECRPIAAAGDEAPRDEPTLRAQACLERTLRWAERCQAARRPSDQLLFGIVQGGASTALRRASARATAELGFDGHAHGGLGLGEPPELRRDLVAASHSELPEAAPRYLMGLGRPEDLIWGVAQGVDLFDCVVPTRHGRHGVVFTSEGTLHLRNAQHRDDSAAPDPACDCPTCARHSRAYLRHLLHVNESLGGRLAAAHNLRFYLRLLEDARAAIAAGSFAAFQRSVEALSAA